MKNNFRSVLLIMSGMFFGFSFEKISNLLYAILYGISYMLILGSFLYIDGYKMSNIKNRCFHIVGIIVLWIANILFFQKVSIAILFSFSLSIAICGAFFTIRKTLLEKTGDGSEKTEKTGDGSGNTGDGSMC